jgi:hypothetical protein
MINKRQPAQSTVDRALVEAVLHELRLTSWPHATCLKGLRGNAYRAATGLGPIGSGDAGPEMADIRLAASRRLLCAFRGEDVVSEDAARKARAKTLELIARKPDRLRETLQWIADVSEALDTVGGRVAIQRARIMRALQETEILADRIFLSQLAHAAVRHGNEDVMMRAIGERIDLCHPAAIKAAHRDGMANPLGPSGDWIETCRKKAASYKKRAARLSRPTGDKQPQKGRAGFKSPLMCARFAAYESAIDREQLIAAMRAIRAT